MSLAKRKRAARIDAQKRISEIAQVVEEVQSPQVELEVQDAPETSPEPPGGTETEEVDSALPPKKQVVKKKSYKQKQE